MSRIIVEGTQPVYLTGHVNPSDTFKQLNTYILLVYRFIFLKKSIWILDYKRVIRFINILPAEFN